jgi:U3 small nucleolar RNA-associated protein 18
MAPETKLARKSSLKKSSAKSKPKPFPLQESDSDADLQLATKANRPQWEGFDHDKEQGSEDESQDELENDSVDIIMDNEDEAPGPDEEEEELERLVFGDSAGFKAGLKSFSLDPSKTAYGSDSEAEAEEGEDLDNVADDQLFFFDSGPGIAPADAVVPAKYEEEEEGDKPAWEDSDDERLVVSLAAVPRLRKLRETEEDDVVNGKEYVRRLRKQFQRLYPTPEWALQAQGRATKRRWTMDASESGGEEASDMDLDDEEKLKTQPLARLLQDADILSRTNRNPAKRRKLQAGVVDIQRLKDVAKKGPVSI